MYLLFYKYVEIVLLFTVRQRLHFEFVLSMYSTLLDVMCDPLLRILLLIETPYF